MAKVTIWVLLIGPALRLFFRRRYFLLEPDEISSGFFRLRISQICTPALVSVMLLPLLTHAAPIS